MNGPSISLLFALLISFLLFLFFRIFTVWRREDGGQGLRWRGPRVRGGVDTIHGKLNEQRFTVVKQGRALLTSFCEDHLSFLISIKYPIKYSSNSFRRMDLSEGSSPPALAKILALAGCFLLGAMYFVRSYTLLSRVAQQSFGVLCFATTSELCHFCFFPMIWNQLMMNSRSRSRSFWKQASDEDDDDD